MILVEPGLSQDLVWQEYRGIRSPRLESRGHRGLLFHARPPPGTVRTVHTSFARYCKSRTANVEPSCEQGRSRACDGR